MNDQEQTKSHSQIPTLQTKDAPTYLAAPSINPEQGYAAQHSSLSPRFKETLDQKSPIGTLNDVAPTIVSQAKGSWGKDLGSVKVLSDPELKRKGKRGAVSNSLEIRVIPGSETDEDLLWEEAGHTVQHENQRAQTQEKQKVSSDRTALEEEVSQAVERVDTL